MQSVYQGCKKSLVGTPDELREKLTEIERTGEWYAQPKYDGWWATIIGRGPEKPPVLVNRGGNLKSPEDLPPLAEGTVAVGEFAFGTQESNARTAIAGHSLVDIFDLIHYPGVGEVAGSPFNSRIALLDRAYKSGIFDSAFYRRAPLWTSHFADLFQEQHEGLILKRRAGGPYCEGYSEDWMKVKKKDLFDRIVFGFVLSSAPTKIATPMAASVELCQYRLGNSCEQIGESLILAAKAGLAPSVMSGNETYFLARTGRCSAGTDEMSRSIAQDFGKWRGKVVKVSAYTEFKSGCLRHPGLASWPRHDKPAGHCIQREDAGGLQ